MRALQCAIGGKFGKKFRAIEIGYDIRVTAPLTSCREPEVRTTIAASPMRISESAH